jgi:Methyltransferase domain
MTKTAAPVSNSNIGAQSEASVPNSSMMKSIVKFFIRNIPRHHLHTIVPFALRVIAPFYRGNRFEDPVSGKTYRKMLPYGRTNSRENALAPDSMSLERHRLQWLFLQRKTNLFKDKVKFLHVAPEYCYMKKFRQMKNLEYFTADLNSPLADIKMDVHAIPFEEKTFDVIMSNHLLEHVENDIKVMSEFYRILKPGGWGIFMVPIDLSRATTYEDASIIDPKEREKHFWQSDHVRLYGTDFSKRLASVGFNVSTERYAEALTDAEIARYSVLREDLIFYCVKPQ